MYLLLLNTDIIYVTVFDNKYIVTAYCDKLPLRVLQHQIQ